MADVLLVGPEDVFPPEMEECTRSHGCQPVRILGAGQAIISSEKADKLLVFLDSDSGQYEALELTRKILSRRPEARIIITAREPSLDMAVDSIKQGACDFLIRPVESEKVEMVIEQALGRNGSGPSSIIEHEENPWAIITDDPEFKRVLSIAEKAASGQASVLIQGESGTGKELLARFIHAKSPRKNKPFVAVNCAALPESLLESELFGHEKGAFTGAISRRLGKFEMANGGTILLDEISEMQIHLQAKLLRVLQEQMVDRVGGASPVPVNVRVIATTNRELLPFIKEGNFREDLYYRLNVIPLHIPPLRNRKGDLPLLLEHLVKKHNIRNNKNINDISSKLIDVLSQLPWNGNVRELENVIERAVVLAPENELRVEHLLLDEKHPISPVESSAEGSSIDTFVGLSVHEVERRLIMSTLDKVSENRTRAAEMLGISIRTLRNKLKEYDSLEKVS